MKQRIVLLGKVSTWNSFNAEDLQGSILGPLLFFIYINTLSYMSSSNVKLLVNHTSLFSAICDFNVSAGDFSDWTSYWKMIFNPVLIQMLVKKPKKLFSQKIKRKTVLLWFSTILKLTHKNT